MTGRAPWQIPGTPLDVACWCGRDARPYPLDQIRRGDTGWSCGRPGCTEDQP